MELSKLTCKKKGIKKNFKLSITVNEVYENLR